ncbi:MAG: single-stranded DNA-binding protein [Saprospiraceae bacterium]
MRKDPEVRRLESEKRTVAKFSLATNETYKDKDGNRRGHLPSGTTLLFGGLLLKLLGEYLKKGSLIYLEGKITYRSTDKESNQKKYFTEIEVANNFKMLDRREGGNREGYFLHRRENAPVSSAPKAAAPYRCQ